MALPVARSRRNTFLSPAGPRQISRDFPSSAPVQTACRAFDRVGESLRRLVGLGHVEQVNLVGVELSRGYGKGDGLAVRRPVRADDGVLARVEQMRVFAHRPHDPDGSRRVFGQVEEKDLCPIGREFGREGVADVFRQSDEFSSRKKFAGTDRSNRPRFARRRCLSCRA